VAVISAAVAFYSAAADLGEPMRWVHIVGLFAAGLASGAGLVKAKADWRHARQAAVLRGLTPVAGDARPT